MDSCRQTAPSVELAVGKEASDLGTGAGAAWGAIVGPARAEHEALAVGPGHGGWAVELDVIDLGTACAGDSVCREGLADAPGDVRQTIDVGRRSMILRVRIRGRTSCRPRRRRRCRFRGQAPRPWRPLIRRWLSTLSIVTKLGPSRLTVTGPTGVSMRCAPGPDAAQVGERDGHADRAVPAHAQVSDVVVEDDTGRARGIDGWKQDGADHHVGAARLADDGWCGMSRAGRERRPAGRPSSRSQDPGRQQPRRGSARRRCGCRSRRCAATVLRVINVDRS